LTDEELRRRIYGRTNKQWLTALFGELTPQQLTAYGDEKEELFRQILKRIYGQFRGLPEFLARLESEGIAMAIGTSAPRANVDFTLSGTGLGITSPLF